MSLVKNRNFMILLSGQLVSTAGNNLFGIALPWYVYSLTGSKEALALTGIAQTVPAITGLFSGVMVDRWRKRATMMGSDGIRAILNFILFGAVLLKWPFSTILLMVLALETAGQFFGPASAALFPLLVNEDQVAAGSGLLQSSNATAQLVGTVSGGALMALLGAPLLFLFNGISFIASVVSLAFIRVRETISPPSQGSSGSLSHNEERPLHRNQQGIKRFMQEWMQGVRLITKSKFLLLVIISALVTNASMAPFDITMTAWVKGPMHGSAFYLGIINGGFFVGIIAGGLLLGTVAKRVPLRALLVTGLVGIGASCAAFGLFRVVLTESLLALFGGFFVGALNGGLNATLITLIPPSMRGRAMGLLGALSTFAMPLGMAVFGTLMIHISLQWVFALIGLLCALSGLSLLLPVKDDKHLLSQPDSPSAGA